MIKYVSGNIFESEMEVITMPCNCIGIAGKGLAKQFVEHFAGETRRGHSFLEDYKFMCTPYARPMQLKPGFPIYLYDWDVLLFPTKNSWRNKSNLNEIRAGLQWLGYYTDKRRKKPITSLALPKIGTGLGQLEWDDVKQVIEEECSHLPIPIEVYDEFQEKEQS